MDLIEVFTEENAQPPILITHEVTGQRVGLVFVYNRATAPPKSGAALVAENSISGIVGDELIERVEVQSGV